MDTDGRATLMGWDWDSMDGDARDRHRAAVIRGLNACPKCGAALDAPRPGRPNRDDEFPAITYRDCLACGYIKVVRKRGK